MGLLLSEYRDGKLFPVTDSKIALNLLFASSGFPDLEKVHKPYQHLAWLNCFWQAP
jgi:hypothetical protein